MPPKRRDSLTQKKGGKNNHEKNNPKKTTKENCLVCKKKTDLAKDSIACNVCGHQFHIQCKDISEENFEIIKDIEAKGMTNPYRCESCKSVLGCLDDRINKNSAEIAKIADKLEANEEVIEDHGGRLKAIEEVVNEMQKKQNKNEQQNAVATSRQIQNELAEQNSRSRNVVFMVYLNAAL